MLRNFPHSNTSPYAYNGQTPMYNDPYRYAGTEDNYAVGSDGQLVSNYTGECVESFCNAAEAQREDFDSIFGLGNKKKQAERKLRRAKKALSKGKTKKAARLTGKADKLLDKIQAGQANTQAGLQKLQDTNVAQATLDKATEAAFNPDTSSVVSPLSVQAMSPTATANQPNTAGLPAPPTGAGGGGGNISDYSDYVSGASQSMGNGIESNISDEPTGDLATEKELGGVTVTAKKKKKLPTALIIGGAVLLIVIIVFMMKGKKGMKF